MQNIAKPVVRKSENRVDRIWGQKFSLIPLLLILLLGTILRMYHLASIPFTHDELSVIFRSGYDSFSELISKGVMPDVHPAGVQVFVNYWVALFGDGEVSVKIPFIVFGILSVFLIYLLGKDWFGESVGLTSAAFASAMEYLIMYSQIARPYSSGLLFSLLMVYAWQRYIFRPGKHPLAWLAVYILASALCAYNHYFSLMFAAIVGLTGLFFIKRRQIIQYCLAGISIFILFIPHLNIFLFQFREKGVEGWLGKPDNDYILQYIGYVFHYSPYVLTIVAGILIAGMISGQSRRTLKNRFFYISLVWFLLPFLTGFFYSKYVNAVLQFSGLIFSFPFLLFLFTAHTPKLNKYWKLYLPLLICLVMSLSLIFERHYYDLFYHSRFREIILETDRNIKEKGISNCLVIMDSHRKISDYYYEKLDIHFDHYDYNDFPSKRDFIDLIRHDNREYLSMGVDSETDLALPGIIMDYFPYMITKIDYQGGNYYLFSKHEKVPDPYRFTSVNGFDSVPPNWSAGDEGMYIDTAGLSNRTSCLYSKQREFGPAFSIPLSELAENKNDIIDVKVSFRNLDSINTSLIALSLSGKKELVEWTAGNVSDFDPGTGEWFTAHHTFRPGKYFGKKDMVLQVSVWDKDKNTFLIDDFCVRSRPGNRYLFGLLEKI